MRSTAATFFGVARDLHCLAQQFRPTLATTPFILSDFRPHSFNPRQQSVIGTMGRKDKIKRSNKKEAAAEKKCKECNNDLSGVSEKLKDKVFDLEDNGMLVFHNKNRSPGELEDAWSSDDIKLQSLKD